LLVTTFLGGQVRVIWGYFDQKLKVQYTELQQFTSSNLGKSLDDLMMWALPIVPEYTTHLLPMPSIAESDEEADSIESDEEPPYEIPQVVKSLVEAHGQEPVGLYCSVRKKRNEHKERETPTERGQKKDGNENSVYEISSFLSPVVFEKEMDRTVWGDDEGISVVLEDEKKKGVQESNRRKMKKTSASFSKDREKTTGKQSNSTHFNPVNPIHPSRTMTRFGYLGLRMEKSISPEKKRERNAHPYGRCVYGGSPFPIMGLGGPPERDLHLFAVPGISSPSVCDVVKLSKSVHTCMKYGNVHRYGRD
jgi:hypothetical protein